MNFLRINNTLINLDNVERIEFANSEILQIVHIFLVSGKQLTFSDADAETIKMFFRGY